MSRTNAKTARQLREAESIQFRKSILKGGVSVSEQERLNGLTAQANEQYEGKLARLQQYKTKAKASSQVKSARTEWVREQQQLAAGAERAEQELMSQVEMLLVHTAGEGLLDDIGDEVVRGAEERAAAKAEVLAHLTELRYMVRELAKHAGEEGPGGGARGAAPSSSVSSSSSSSSHLVALPDCENGEVPVQVEVGAAAGDGEGGGGAGKAGVRFAEDTKEGAPAGGGREAMGRGAAAGIVADMLMQIRGHQEYSWKVLREEEEALSAGLVPERRELLSGLREDRREELAAEVRQGLQLLPSDDAETEVFIEEMLGKIHGLVQGHDRMLQAVAAQLADLSVTFGARAAALSGLPAPPAPAAAAAAAHEGTAPGSPAPTDPTASGTEAHSETAGSSGGGGGGRYAGWSEDDHRIFIKINKRAESAGLPRKTIVEQYRLQLGHVKPFPQAVDLHEEWYRAAKLLHLKRSELNTAHESRLAEVAAACRQDLQKFRADREVARAAEVEMAAFEQRRQGMHSQLDRLRAERAVREAEAAAAAEELEAEERARREEALEAARERQAAMHAEVEAYKQKQLEIQMEQKLREAAAERERQAAVKAQIDQNREKVEQRAEAVRAKEEARRQREEELAAQEARRLDLLAKIAQQCPYWEGLQDVKSRLDHVTAAAQAGMYVQGEEAGRGHIPLFGFADKNVIKDARFRLVSALRSAGVHNSSYAVAAVAKINPRPHLAIHGIL